MLRVRVSDCARVTVHPQLVAAREHPRVHRGDERGQAQPLRVQHPVAEQLVHRRRREGEEDQVLVRVRVRVSQSEPNLDPDPNPNLTLTLTLTLTFGPPGNPWGSCSTERTRDSACPLAGCLGCSTAAAAAAAAALGCSSCCCCCCSSRCSCCSCRSCHAARRTRPSTIPRSTIPRDRSPVPRAAWPAVGATRMRGAPAPATPAVLGTRRVAARSLG